jgi:hypothetical protein
MVIDVSSGYPCCDEAQSEYDDSYQGNISCLYGYRIGGHYVLGSVAQLEYAKMLLYQAYC